MKKYIYQLERQQHDVDASIHDLESSERASLIDGSTSTDAVFLPLLDRELKKIALFYESQERELLDELAELEGQIKEQEEAGLDGGYQYMDHDDDDDDDDSPSRSVPPRRRRRKSSAAANSSRFQTGVFLLYSGRPWCGC